MEVFFYGLFMDETILSKNGIDPLNPRKGYLKDYQLKIGNRASLVPSPDNVCYGIIMNCDSNALNKLYSEPSVADYLPEDVIVFADKNEPIEARCYNLPLEKITGTNSKYATSLYALAKRLDFPEEYLRKIQDMIED